MKKKFTVGKIFKKKVPNLAPEHSIKRNSDQEHDLALFLEIWAKMKMPPLVRETETKGKVFKGHVPGVWLRIGVVLTNPCPQLD